MNSIWIIVIQELLHAIINVLDKQSDSRASALREEFASLHTRMEEMKA